MSYILRVLQTGEGESSKLGIKNFKELLSASISYLSCCRMEIELIGPEEIGFITKIVDSAVEACEKTSENAGFEFDTSIIEEIHNKSKEFEDNSLN